MHKSICMLVGIVFLSFLASCSKSSINFLSNSICQAPCWRGIDMGASEENATDMLRKMSDVDDASIKVTQVNRPLFEKELHWQFKDSDEAGSIILDSNKVNQMYFPLRQQLKLSSLIELYGQPDDLVIIKTEVEGTSINVYFLYQNRGICLAHHAFVFPLVDSTTYKVNSNIHVSEIYYADPAIENWQINIGCGGGFQSDEYSNAIQRWKGYSNYQIYPGN